MKTILLLLMATMLLQQGAEPPEYPKDWYCTPNGINAEGIQTPNDPCHCHRVDTSVDCEGRPAETNTCKQWCHASDNKGREHNHCHCPIVCHPVDPQTDPENPS